jgi:hypothetical protein
MLAPGHVLSALLGVVDGDRLHLGQVLVHRARAARSGLLGAEG